MTRRAIEFSISVSHFLGGYPPVRACPITLAEVRDQRISQFISVKEECDQLERPPDSELRIRPPDSDPWIRLPDSDLRTLPPDSDLRIPPPNHSEICKWLKVKLNGFKLNFKLRI